MIWDFHGLLIAGESNDERLLAHWAESYASLPNTTGQPELVVSLDIAATLPPPPARTPAFQADGFLAYYLDGPNVIANLPGFAYLEIELATGRSHAHCTEAVLTTYGILDDLIAIALSPHLRRRGWYPVHAFAAAWQGQGILLVGDQGAGKTTTGLALLTAGWQLLANDAPLLHPGGILSYPGQLAAWPRTWRQFPETAALAGMADVSEAAKISVAPDAIRPDIWLAEAPLAAILFPQIEKRPDHTLEPLGPAETLRRLLPHTLENWDPALIPAHLRFLRQLAEQTPGYLLHLGQDLAAIAPLLRPLCLTSS
ncbi:MAG: hypothetical protein H6651_18795 [Ardenticatenales bacterium]|nr:hypothetical protein [Ardenticatenales bacterium]